MNRKVLLVLSVVLVATIAISGCANLLPQDDEPVTGEFGSPYTPQEHQLRTFEALWKNLQENYIYFDTANVDWTALHTKYTDEIKGGLSNEQFNSLLNKLGDDLPSGTMTFQSRTERIAAETIDTSTYGGIGAYVGYQAEPQPHIIILDVMDGSPADQAGIKPHDSLLMIDGAAISLEEGIDAVDRVRGPAGTTVELTIQSPGKVKRVVEVTRGQLSNASKLEAYEIAGKPYGYMLVPPIAYEGLTDEILANLQTFTTNKTLKGLILDLRVAGSARGWPLEDLFTIFHDGEIGEFFDRSKSQKAAITGQDMFGSQTVPLVILVGANTTGSPEILAGSLQAYGRATIVGETTPGSIEATTTFILPDGSRVFIETTSFRLPDGGDIGNNGVKPTVGIEAGWGDVHPEADPVLEKAIELLEVQP